MVVKSFDSLGNYGQFQIYSSTLLSAPLCVVTRECFILQQQASTTLHCLGARLEVNSSFLICVLVQVPFSSLTSSSCLLVGSPSSSWRHLWVSSPVREALPAGGRSAPCLKVIYFLKELKVSQCYKKNRSGANSSAKRLGVLLPMSQ